MIAARWRLVAVMAASAAAGLMLVHAVTTSERVAAARAAKEAPAVHDAPADPPTLPLAYRARPDPPKLPLTSQPLVDETLHQNIVVASADSVESCRRAVRGLVSSALGTTVVATDHGKTFWESDPSVQGIADTLGDSVAITCSGAAWPELYVICEGTVTDMLDGTVTCYPYDPFE